MLIYRLGDTQNVNTKGLNFIKRGCEKNHLPIFGFCVFIVKLPNKPAIKISVYWAVYVRRTCKNLFFHSPRDWNMLRVRIHRGILHQIWTLILIQRLASFPFLHRKSPKIGYFCIIQAVELRFCSSAAFMFFARAVRRCSVNIVEQYMAVNKNAFPGTVYFKCRRYSISPY